MTDATMLLALVFLLFFVSLLLFFTTRVRQRQKPNLRRIQAFDAVKDFTGKAIEVGRPLHLSVGTGRVADATTADSLAGLYTLNHLAKQAAITGIQPIVSTADPTIMLLAQNIVRAAHKENASGSKPSYQDIRWIATQPAAYAAGVMGLIGVDQVETNIMIGNFGDEFLLMGEAGALRGVSQVGGASDPNTLPFVYASTDETLFGEEIYAAGAYLQQNPIHLGSLLAQDTMRWVVGLLIVGGIIITTLGL